MQGFLFIFAKLPETNDMKHKSNGKHQTVKKLLMVWLVVALQTGMAAAEPKAEGVVLLQQGDWPAEVVATFHNTPWLDAASIRLKWSELEPRDQEFNWAPFDKLLA